MQKGWMSCTQAPQYVKSGGMIRGSVAGGIKNKPVGLKHNSNKFISVGN